MTAVNIKTDHGAAGDGQLFTATLSIASGQKHLTSPSALWVPGDVAKSIAIEGAGTVSGANPLGSLLSTISSVDVDGKGVVIADNAVTTLSAVSKQVEWGTNDNTAFTAFKNAHQGQAGVQLAIPAGRYCFSSAGASNGFGFGITGLTAQGAGDPVLSDMLGSANGVHLGGSLAGVSGAGIRTQTALADATTIVLVTASQISSFSANSWAVMTGLDVQGFGNPPNPYFFEFVYITAIHVGSGGSDPSTVTIQTPLQNEYKSTWPAWTAGLGGPATLYPMSAGWDCDHIYNDIVVASTATVYNCVGRGLLIDGGNSVTFGPNVSQNKDFTLVDHNIPTLWEIDKMCESLTIGGSTTIHGIDLQSAAPNLLTIGSGVVIENQFNGTPKRLVTSGFTYQGTAMSIGPHSHGAAEGVEATNSSIAGFGFGGVSEADVTGAGAYSMSNGIISRVKSGGSGSPPQWAIPDRWGIFNSRFTPGAESVFHIEDVYEDGTSVYIKTNLSGGFPSPISPATTLRIGTHPCEAVTFSGCTGSDAALSLSNLDAGDPLWGGWDLTYSGNIGVGKDTITLFGAVRSVRVTVGAGYSAGTFHLDNPFVLRKSDNTFVLWNPVFDLTRPGIRTITTSSVAGSLGSDAGLTLTGDWLVPGQITPKMSGAVGGGTVRLQINLDQGVTVEGHSSAVARSAPDPFTADDLANLRHHQDELKKATQRRSKDKREVEARLRDAVEEVYDKLSGIAPAAAAKVAAVIPAKAKITETAASSDDETPAIDWSKVTTTQIAKVIATMDAYAAQLAAEQRQRTIASADAARERDEDDIESLLMSTP